VQLQLGRLILDGDASRAEQPMRARTREAKERFLALPDDEFA
jgi:hypothetical protein